MTDEQNELKSFFQLSSDNVQQRNEFLSFSITLLISDRNAS